MFYSFPKQEQTFALCLDECTYDGHTKHILSVLAIKSSPDDLGTFNPFSENKYWPCCTKPKFRLFFGRKLLSKESKFPEFLPFLCRKNISHTLTFDSRFCAGFAAWPAGSCPTPRGCRTSSTSSASSSPASASTSSTS
jgi:hypothetical protein